MKRLLALVLVLVVVSPAMAAFTIGIDAANWSVPGKMTVRVVVTTADTGDVFQAVAFGSTMYLTGTNAASFTASTIIGTAGTSNRTGAQMATLVSPTAYAWDIFDTKTNVYSTGRRQDFDQTDGWDDPVSLGSLSVGDVVAVYMYTYTGDYTTFSEVKAHLYQGGSTSLGGPQVAGDPTGTSEAGVGPFSTIRTLNVANQDVNLVPEPATMGLLGLGLIGLVIRRKKA